MSVCNLSGKLKLCLLKYKTNTYTCGDKIVLFESGFIAPSDVYQGPHNG